MMKGGNGRFIFKGHFRVCMINDEIQNFTVVMNGVSYFFPPLLPFPWKITVAVPLGVGGLVHPDSKSPPNSSKKSDMKLGGYTFRLQITSESSYIF